MTSDDHLGNEVSVSAKIDKTGIEAKAKSRFVSGFDRLCGNLTETVNVWIEDKTTGKRKRIESRNALLAAATKSAESLIANDPNLALRILQTNFDQAARRQSNKDKIAEVAAEFLALNPPTKEQQERGSDTLSADFLNRFERYAEDASSEEVQAKWANVLAGEVRRPGTFGGKVMRILDEIDNETAQDFAELIKYRIGTETPLALYEPSIKSAAHFEEYELIHSRTASVRVMSKLTTLSNGVQYHLFMFKPYAFAVPSFGAKDRIEQLDRPNLLNWDYQSASPAIPIVSLTNSGRALLQIHGDNSKENADILLHKIRSCVPDTILLVEDEETGNYSSL